jgi:glycerol-3-phosphate dehydrogenase (NAD(P)+)
MSILVLGAGAFGTSLAQSFALGGTNVTLWGRDAAAIEAQNTSRLSSKLVDVRFNDRVTLTSELSEAIPEVVLLAVPLQTLRSVLGDFPQLNGKTLVACCKGIELSSGKGPVSIINSRDFNRAELCTRHRDGFADCINARLRRR